MKVLIADDEKNIRQVLKKELAEERMDVDEAEDGLRALERLRQTDYDVLLLDLMMPGMNGIEVLQSLKAQDIPTEVIILTANATVNTAVEAMKLGAYDYLTKPFPVDELLPVIEKAYEKKKLREENVLLKARLRSQAGPLPFVAASPAMRQLVDLIRKTAPTDLPVLITGESGVGKEVVATRIHSESGRSDGPFVPINCGALPESMIESELFGYEKGAFTGAHARKIGLMEVAHGGTLFLDEIGDMPAVLQVKLLRVIETGTFFRLGGTREVKVNVRFLSATNRDVEAAVKSGEMRQDLFYRIAALTVHVPPLRERLDDLLPLIETFSAGNPVFRQKRLSEESLRVIRAYAWPGNCRELKHVIQRALLLSPAQVVEPSDLSINLTPSNTIDTTRLDDMEREHILRILREAGGHRGKAAEMLGIDRKTLYRKLESYGISE